MGVLVGRAGKPQIGNLVRTSGPVFHNMGLIAAGSLIFVIGMNSVMVPAGLFSGGLVGIAMLVNYHWPGLDIGQVYLLLNIPLAVLGWMSISHRFMRYTFFGMAFFSLAAMTVRTPLLGVRDPILAALLSGVICGTGCGVILRSSGSAGGMDILAVFIRRRYGIRVGSFLFAANATVIVAGAYIQDINLALYSLIYLFACGRVTNLIVTGFNTRKAVWVISDRSHEMAQTLLADSNRGVTFLDGEGAYTGNRKKVLFTVTTLMDLPRLKEKILTVDPAAFIVVNDTLEVLGQRDKVMRTF